MDCKCAAGIVSYNPDITRIMENINSVVGQVDRLYIYDNGSQNTSSLKKLLYQYGERVVFIENSGNSGIAVGLNKIISLASEAGYEWVLTLDQDSVIPEGVVSSMGRYTSERMVGIVCPQYYDKRRNEDKPVISLNKYSYVNFCITSGALTKVEAWDCIGKFDETLFIGLVDNEFSYRLSLNGYKIVQDKSVLIDHELGDITQSLLNPLWKTLYRTTHKQVFRKLAYKRSVSSLRVYYETRNMVYLNRKYSKNSVDDWSVKQLVSYIISMLIRGKNRIRLLKVAVKGIKDGYKLIVDEH